MVVLEAALTLRERLYEVAVGQNGYVTSADAVSLGIRRDQLRKLSSGSGITRIAHGLYRFDAMPVSDTDEYMEAVLRVGPGAYLTRQSVLSMHSLGLVNPRYVYVGTSRRSRRRLPATVKVDWRTLPQTDLTVYDGIPSSTVHRALLDCVDIIMRDRFDDAVQKARDEGLLTAREVEDIQNKVQR